MVQWWCRCECGNEKTIDQSSLTSGNTRSCGCLWMDVMKSRCAGILDKTFSICEKFGTVTILEVVTKPSRNNGLGYFRCQCECGDRFSTNGKNLCKYRDQSRCHTLCKLSEQQTPKYCQDVSNRYLYSVYARIAKKSGKTPLLIDEWKHITSQPCYYCGDIETRSCVKHGYKIRKERKHLYDVKPNSIGRISSQLGLFIGKLRFVLLDMQLDEKQFSSVSVSNSSEENKQPSSAMTQS